MAAGSQYGYPMGAVFIFNLVVGTGTLSMPNAFASAGYIFSILLICSICLISYITVTFLTESLSIANAIVCLSRKEAIEESPDKYLASLVAPVTYSSQRSDPETSDNNVINEDDDNALLLRATDDNITSDSGSDLRSKEDLSNQVAYEVESMFEIVQKFEMGELCKMLVPNQLLTIFYYFCICIYLYGDLAIYAAAVPKSVRDVVCSNLSDFANQNDDDPCWTGHDISRLNIYRCFLAIFICTFGIFAFFDVSKTALLQLCTGLVRWSSLIMMVSLACIRIGRGDGVVKSPSTFDIGGFFGLFGVLIYSFMCHHSIPALIVPMRDKKYVREMILMDYLIALSFYSTNSIVAVFAFDDLEDLYTENFVGSESVKLGCKYYIGLFPALVLCSSFPIVAVVLRNNLKALFRQLLGRHAFPFIIDRIVFPCACLLFPLVVAMITDDVTSLMKITGGLSGAFIEFFFPTLIVYFARKSWNEIKSEQTSNLEIPSHARSFFTHPYFVFGVWAWTAFCVIMTVIGFFVN